MVGKTLNRCMCTTCMHLSPATSPQQPLDGNVQHIHALRRKLVQAGCAQAVGSVQQPLYVVMIIHEQIQFIQHSAVLYAMHACAAQTGKALSRIHIGVLLG